MRRRPLLAILCLAAVVRAGPLACAWKNPQALRTSDSRGYLALAESLAQTGRFEREGVPEIFRTPGYPLLLLLGEPFGESGWRIVAGVQVAADLVLVYLTYLLGLALCDRRAAVLAAAFQALSDAAIASSLRVLSDGLFALLLTLAVLLAVVYLRTRRTWTLAGAAGVVAAASYVRPAGLAFAVVLLAVLIFRRGGARVGQGAGGLEPLADGLRRAPFGSEPQGRRQSSRRGSSRRTQLARAAGFAAVVVLATAPWVVRNGLRADYWGFSSLGQQVAFDYQAPAALAEAQGISLREAREEMRLRLPPPSLPPASPGARAAEQLRASLAVLREHPGEYALAHAKGCAAVWLPGATDVLEVAGLTAGGRGTLDLLRREGPWAAAESYFRDCPGAILAAVPLVLVLLIKYASLLAGIARRLRLRMPAEHWLVAATIAVFVLLPGPAGHPRFRTPVEPLLGVLAGAGLSALLRARGRSPQSSRA